MRSVERGIGPIVGIVEFYVWFQFLLCELC